MTGIGAPGHRLPAAGVGLAIGLVLSAAIVAALGGWVGVAMSVAQLAAAVALLVRPADFGIWAAAALALVPPPVAALRHWTAGLPFVCHCQRLPTPPPGLVSLTGAVVLADLALIALAAWQAGSK